MTTIDANNKPSAAVDTSNVIPFPDRRAAHQQPEKPESRTFSLPLRHVVHKAKDVVLRFIRRPNAVGMQRKPSATTASAAQCLEHHHPTPQHHGGSAVGKRMSA